MMRHALLALTLCLVGCDPGPPHGASGPATTNFSISYEGVPIGPPPLTYAQRCIRKPLELCGTLGAVWQKEMTVDICIPEDVCPVYMKEQGCLLSVGECKKVFDCDPTEYDLGEEPCVTVGGKPGTRTKYCDKGHLRYSDCHALGECNEEVCDYKDNDCDGRTDEGQRNACDECGLVGEDICNTIDDDCDGATDEYLAQVCTTECGSGFQGCVLGTWTTCSSPQPSEEVCDSADNDCDGLVDEGLACGCPVDLIGSLFKCKEPPILCGEGWRECRCTNDDCMETELTECHALCFYLPVEGEECIDLGDPVPEECNNHDDDCDCPDETGDCTPWIDEGLTQACYTGPPGTANVGICLPGNQECQQGMWGWDEPFVATACDGQRLPAETDYCNGQDDDCDGITDAYQEMTETDIVFVLDWSGSMSEEIEAVMQAMAMFAETYKDEEVLQWSLIVGPRPDGVAGKDYLEIVQDLGPFSAFQGGLAGLEFTVEQGAYEMLIDALWLILGGGSDDITWISQVTSVPDMWEFTLSWREDAQKLVILWTDEKAQSFVTPKIWPFGLGLFLTTVPDLYLYTFTQADPENIKESWAGVAGATKGKWLELSMDPNQQFSDLKDILDEAVCK